MKRFTREELVDIFEKYQEEVGWPASKQVQSSRDAFHFALDDYVANVFEDAFLKGYQYAMMQNGGAVHK